MTDMSKAGAIAISACEADEFAEVLADAMIATGLKVFHPHPLLADLVEDVWDLDIPDGNVARRLIIRMPPSAYAFLSLQYRVPIVSDWTFGIDDILQSTQRHVAVKMQTGIITARPVGPLGAVIIRIKPEASERVIRAPLSHFLDQKVDLHEILSKQALAQIEGDLAEAPHAEARFALVEDLLFREIRPLSPRTPLMQAAARLRFDPALSIRQLAMELDISVRHLSRGFKAAFGTGPKQFARLARVEKAVAARRDGHRWCDIAHACGFADQAHLIHDFRAIIGAAPEEIFRPPLFRTWRAEGKMRIRPFFNLFVAG
ncbi:helix-turn-helix domain-containing protein [Tardiphaga sp.]|jgi:AraC-like DNA-binding protein|uniref:helix-turn-helix domain-containing protein n=1 Tax=Tardiphaga sp. TaxID=1926292 RepID=UPI0037D9ABE6